MVDNMVALKEYGDPNEGREREIRQYENKMAVKMAENA